MISAGGMLADKGQDRLSEVRFGQPVPASLRLSFEAGEYLRLDATLPARDATSQIWPSPKLVDR